MRNPVHILGVLVACAVVAGVALWLARENFEPDGAAGDSVVSGDNPTSPPDAADERPDTGESSITGPPDDGVAATGTPEPPGADTDTEPGSATPDSPADQGSAPAVDLASPDAIAEQVYVIRKLRPRTPIEFAAVPRDEINERIRQEVLASATPEDFVNQARALVAMGFVFDDTFEDLAPPVIGLRTNQEAAVYDAETGTIVFPDNAPLRNPTERGKLVQEITRALQIQNFEAGTVLAAVPGDADTSLARRALALGDATQVKIRYNLVDQFSADVPPPSPESQQQFYDAPIFVREVSLFPYFHGAKFVEALQLEGGWERVNEAFSRPPASTAEILHPELYLSDPPFAPVPVALAAPAIGGTEPIWSDVAGEFAIGLLLKILIDVNLAEPAAEGWLGDRYAVYPNGAVLWKTVWRNPDEAAEFTSALRRYLGARYQIPEDDFVRDEGGIRYVDDAVQVEIRQRPDLATVGLVMAADPAFHRELTAAAAAAFSE